MFDLDSSKEMNPGGRDGPQEGVVRLVLLGHKEEQHPVKHLDPIERVDPHVEEDAVENLGI